MHEPIRDCVLLQTLPTTAVLAQVPRARYHDMALESSEVVELVVVEVMCSVHLH